MEKRRTKINEDSLRDICDEVKASQNLNYRYSRRRRQKERAWENISVEIVKIFPKMRKEITTQVQESQRVPYRINSRWNTQRHIIVKLTKIRPKEQILKTAREKQQIIHKGIPIKITADLSTETYSPGGNGRIYLKWWKGKT